MDLSLSVEELPGVGRYLARRLEKLGIKTLQDLISHYPFRYEDYSEIKKISKIDFGEVASLQGTIWSIKNTRTRYGKFLTLAQINDGTGTIQVVWFNQPFLTKLLKPSIEISMSGKVGEFNKLPTLINPDYEILRVGARTIHTGRLVPIYPETRGVSSKWLRAKIAHFLPQAADKLSDDLPKDLIEKETLLEKSDAIEKIHFPNNIKEAERARYTLSFAELFYLQILALKRKDRWDKGQSLPFKVTLKALKKFLKSLPYELTNAQKRALNEIIADLKKRKPMNRLLEGDVGSGKTVVAATAMYLAHLNGRKSLIMAPTEILALQHYKTISTLLRPFDLKITLVTRTSKPKKVLKEKQMPDILVGTHALLYVNLEFESLGLVVIDEQHRFGVEQRAVLRGTGISPHFLSMTATPIPRTLALTLYGDLDLSLIDESPPGRQIVKTYLVPPEKRLGAYDFIKKRVEKGEQAFIICPLIEPSETLGSVKAAKAEFERLNKEVFVGSKLALLHGKVKSGEKDGILTDFKEKKYQILVATPVVEVGIDIPSATVIMIEGAERFGLAQLHQLRGRVGRSSLESYCLLFTDSASPRVRDRLKSLERYHSGVELAEIDLKLRGPGELYGTAQSGIPNLKVASLSDVGLIEKTRQSAEKIFKNDPRLEKHRMVKDKVGELEKLQIAPD